MNRAPTRAERITALLLSALYATAGLLHLVHPEPFMLIVPPAVPWPREMVLATGVAELAGAAGLQIRRWRKWAGLGLALYALMVWPANLKHAVDGLVVAGLPTSWWYHGPRLALQPVLVIAALHAGGWLRRRNPTAPTP